MQNQEAARQSGGRGFNVVRAVYANLSGHLGERKAKKEAYAQLFTQFDRIFDENPDRANEHIGIKQKMELPTHSNGDVTLERSLLQNPKRRHHHIHLRNPADETGITIGLSQILAEIVPRKMTGDDVLDWVGSPTTDDSTPLTLEQTRRVYGWLEAERQELETLRAEQQAADAEAALA